MDATASRAEGAWPPESGRRLASLVGGRSCPGGDGGSGRSPAPRGTVIARSLPIGLIPRSARTPALVCRTARSDAPRARARARATTVRSETPGGWHGKQAWEGQVPDTQKSWRRPIFPKGCPLSIFGAGELDFRVRDGNGYGLSASVTRIRCVWMLFGCVRARPPTGGRRGRRSAVSIFDRFESGHGPITMSQPLTPGQLL
jgi:hypothetical protein